MRRLLLSLIFAVGMLGSFQASAVGPCTGRFPNPITDMCWACFFPITIAGVPIGLGFDDYMYPPPLCFCPAPPPVFVRPGIGMTYWSPDRAVEVVRTPMCSPILNGTILGTLPTTEGQAYGFKGADKAKPAFYHVHWMQMPIIQQLQLVAEGSLCLKADPSMDIALLTEIDPLWIDDELAFIIAPESILFANVIANVACAPDAIKASVANFGVDSLFWCSGAHGSVYPLSGHKQYHKGGVDTAMNLAHRVAFTLHRVGLLWDVSTVMAMCQDLPQPMMRKGQYKVAFMLPLANVARGYGFGAATDLYEQGKEIPFVGEDWAMMIWRRHTCCAL